MEEQIRRLTAEVESLKPKPRVAGPPAIVGAAKTSGLVWVLLLLFLAAAGYFIYVYVIAPSFVVDERDTCWVVVREGEYAWSPLRLMRQLPGCSSQDQEQCRRQISPPVEFKTVGESKDFMSKYDLKACP